MKLPRLITDFRDLSDTTESMTALAGLVEDAAHDLGCQYIAVLHTTSLMRGAERLTRYDNYPAGWERRVVGRGQSVIDPSLSIARRRASGFLWSDALAKANLSDAQRAILDAAWAELTERGYAGMTFDAVADRAGTSKPVLYRRWPSKGALLPALLAHRGVMVSTAELPETGSLRDDVLALLRGMNAGAGSMVGIFSSMIGAYYDETGTTPAQLRAIAFGGNRTGMQRVVAQAELRGEVAPGSLPERVVSLPSDLVRHELVMTLAPVADDVLLDVVDTVFMPLVQMYAARTG